MLKVRLYIIGKLSLLDCIVYRWGVATYCLNKNLCVLFLRIISPCQLLMASVWCPPCTRFYAWEEWIFLQCLAQKYKSSCNCLLCAENSFLKTYLSSQKRITEGFWTIDEFLFLLKSWRWTLASCNMFPRPIWTALKKTFKSCQKRVKWKKISRVIFVTVPFLDSTAMVNCWLLLPLPVKRL